MWSICKKDIGQFFSNLTGYIAIILFLLINGVVLFLLQDSSILNNGYASIEAFFDLAPWVFLFLVPAISMRSFADEYKTGTFEILQTKPLSHWQIVWGKYFSVVLIVFLVLIPTLVYVYSISALSATGTIDTGGIIGSYIGLFLLGAAFSSISIACSSFTNNAVVSFLLSGFVCLLLYIGCAYISKITFFMGGADYFIDMLGIDFHYKSVSRGVLDTRDLVYFMSIILLALLITAKNIQKR
jgi:ABC-2 type transport system permease protein